MANAYVKITGQDQLSGPLKKAQSELTTFGQVAQRVGKMIDTASVILAVVAAVKALTDAVGESVKAFKEQVEVDTRLDAVLKATGEQYKYTTRDIKEYANALQSQTRFADDAIESAAQLLVATKKFDKEGLERTLDLSADLAEAMGTDITSAAQTLSKALIEPGEGLSRLKTIGISFTDSEEAMIKSLRDAGDELAAQQVILEKVEASYGGVAKSIGSIDTSTLDKIGHVWGDLKEDLGHVFTNLLGPVFQWIYDTLSWLQRLTNQVAQKSDFKKAMRAGDVQALADNFTTEYLTEQLSKTFKDYGKAVKLLMEDYSDVFMDIDERFHMNVEEFLSQTQEQQWDMLKEILGEDDIRTFYITQIADDVYETVQLTKALELQQEQAAEAEKRFRFEQENAAAQRSQKLVESIGGLGTIFSDAKLALFNEATVAGLTGNIFQTITKGYLGSGISDSAYMSIMFGELGMWAQTTDAFMLTMYDWGDNIDDLAKKVEMSPLFASPTLSTLGLNGIKGLDFSENVGTEELKSILEQYGKNSVTYQGKILDEEIDYLEGVKDLVIKQFGSGSPMDVYLGEILENLGKQKDSLNKIEKDTRTFIDKLGEKVGTAVGSLFGADDEQGKAAGSAIISSFTSQMGEAGEVVSRLATNMATMGPLLGAIVTALHYVIGGIMETLKDVFNDFIQWGIEPLKEFGRMIGEILLPVFKEIMPSVIASGQVLMRLFQALSKAIAPLVEVLMKVLGPILTVLADIIVAFAGTISWVIEGLKYVVTWLLNKITFGAVQVSDNPGSLSDYVSNMMVMPGEGYESISANSTGVTNASYSGGTVIHMNVINNGVVCGDSGIQEFSIMIRDNLLAAGWNGR